MKLRTQFYNCVLNFLKALDFLKIMIYNIIKLRFSKSRLELTEVFLCLLEERQN